MLQLLRTVHKWLTMAQWVSLLSPHPSSSENRKLSFCELYDFMMNPNTPKIQCYPSASSSLPFPSEEFRALHRGCPVIQVIPPCSHGHCIIEFLLHDGFQLLLFDTHTVCIGIDTLELCFWSWHLLRRESLIPVWLFSSASTVCNTPTSLVSLLPQMRVAMPSLHWEGRSKHCARTRSLQHWHAAPSWSEGRKLSWR